MSRYGAIAVLLVAALGCCKQSANDVAASRAECEALKSDIARAAAEVETLKSELDKSRAELARVRAEADEKLGRDTAEFFLTALARMDGDEARSVCTAAYARRVYVLSRSGWGWQIVSQTIAPERDQVVIRGTLVGEQAFILRLIRQGTTWKVDGFTFAN
jgi:hypothetical protein